jgi:hypothetical protein
VHKNLGPGLLESIYEKCLKYELEKNGYEVKQQIIASIIYDDLYFDTELRLDLLVNDLICIDDLITGSCSCIKLQEHEEKTTKIMDEINKINTILNPSIDEDGFTASIAKKRKDELTEMLIIKKKEFLNCKRMVHVTEKGMIPLNVQIEIKKNLFFIQPIFYLTIHWRNPRTNDFN